MRFQSRLVLGALAGFACIPAGAHAASDGDRQSASAVFSQSYPGYSTGLEFAIDYVNPDDPMAKPPAVRTVQLTLARGSVIDPGALPQCEATDAELMLLGASSCESSVVGDGLLTLDTGLQPRFLENDITLLNDAGELIFLFRSRETGARVASRAPITDGRTITSQAPFLPGSPPDGAAADTVAESIAESAGSPYITTPQWCPRSRRWVNRWTFTYADGVSQTVRSPSRCRPWPRV